MQSGAMWSGSSCMDVDRRSSGEIEAAVCLAAACVDIDKRRAMYALPLAVAPEKRVTRGQLEK